MKAHFFTHKQFKKKRCEDHRRLNGLSLKRILNAFGVGVTRTTPIVEMVSGIEVKNQNFSVPLKFNVKNGQGIVENRSVPPSTAFYISIPGFEKDRNLNSSIALSLGCFSYGFSAGKIGL